MYIYIYIYIYTHIGVLLFFVFCCFLLVLGLQFADPGPLLLLTLKGSKLQGPEALLTTLKGSFKRSSKGSIGFLLG